MAVRTRRILVVVGVLTATVLMAEGAARALGPYLPAPAWWPDRTTAVKVAQMERLSCADVVVAGNSMARDAFDPARFTSSDPTGRSAYNAALDAAGPTHLGRWLSEEVVPRLDPTLVVLAVSSADLNSGSRAAASARQSYESSIRGRPDSLGRIQAFVMEHVALMRHRDALRRPEEFSGAVERMLAGDRIDRRSREQIPGLLGPRGQGLSRQQLTHDGDPNVERFVREQLLAEYHIGADQLDTTAATIADLRQHGVEVALVVLPVTDDYASLHPDGARDLREALDHLRDLASSAEVPMLDLHDLLDSDDTFADTHHVNAAGAAAVTDELARALPVTDARCSEAAR